MQHGDFPADHVWFPGGMFVCFFKGDVLEDWFDLIWFDLTWFDWLGYPLVSIQKAIEYDLVKMVIFHRCVGSPEGMQWNIGGR